MATTTKRQIARRIAERTGQTQVITKEIVQQFFDGIVDELGKGHKLEFRDFGVFEVVTRRSRTGRNRDASVAHFTFEGSGINLG